MDRPMPVYAYTSEPDRVIEIWWSWEQNVFYDFDPNEEGIDLPFLVLCDRENTFKDALGGAIEAEFPNLKKTRFENSGWDGDWAQFSPRAICDDENLIYEPFFDHMNRITEQAAALAIEAHPWDYEMERADRNTEAELEEEAKTPHRDPSSS